MNVLISVYDKSGIVDFARQLQTNFGARIISTGGTLDLLQQEGISVTAVEEYTGFPEMMDGRVKTLHPRIHGGILSLRDRQEHMEEAIRHNIQMIDMVVVNLYPFEEVVARGADFAEVIENIDIGGPSMLRSAAKNHKHVAVIADPVQYPMILEELRLNGGTVSDHTRRELARDVFWKTARYDAAIARYLSDGSYQSVFVEKVSDLRYGENPDTAGALFRLAGSHGGITDAKILHGKEMSFLNYYDTDAAFRIVSEFDMPAAAIIKHANPCGVGADVSILSAFKKAHKADPLSAFGGIVALNRPCTLSLARHIIRKELFLEVILAPKFEKKALEVLMEKKNLRLLELPMEPRFRDHNRLKQVSGGLLWETQPESSAFQTNIVTALRPNESQLQDMLFAWNVVCHVKSNAIVVSRAMQTLGVGAGQMSRVDAVEIALRKARRKARGAVLASDAFFPFPDSIEKAHKAGISCIIQPGGSVRDAEVIAKCEEYGIAMVFTGKRVFSH